MKTKLVSIITVILIALILAPAAHAYDYEVLQGTVIQKITSDGKTLEDGLLCEVASAYGTAGSPRVIVFLIGYPKYADTVDGDSVGVTATPVGTFSYTTTAGATKTVRKFKFRPLQ